MKIIKAFEQRLNDVFGSAPQGFTAPISFRKLAKHAMREMENETIEVDGTYTAPPLYDILVAPSDDATMRTMYPQITAEISAFIEAEGKRRGYVFVGEPLARFMVDPSLRSGRFAVFAQNITLKDLTRLHHDEEAFLTGGFSMGGAASVVTKPNPIEPSRDSARHPHRGAATLPAIENPVTPITPPVPSVTPTSAPNHLREIPVTDPIALPVSGAPLSDDSVGLGVIPTDYVDSQYAGELGRAVATVSPAAPAPVFVPVSASAPPAQQKPKSAAHSAPATAPAPDTQHVKKTCTLIDHQSGRTYVTTTYKVIIGRERATGGIVLHDPNISRRHAELDYDGRLWHITDLKSTNGTLVNDVDVDSCVLHNGDLITIGLMNLEFREN